MASGPGPLMQLHDSIRKTLDQNIGQPLSVTSIVDIMNLIGRCVVSGNVDICFFRNLTESRLEEPLK